MAEVLEIRGLDIYYGDYGAVRGVDLNLEEGELTALVGPSGCGKTSLLRAIAGFETPAQGFIHLAGRCLVDARNHVAPEARRVGMVFQQGALFPHLTVLENVLYGLPAGAERRPTAQRSLERVSMAHRAHHRPDELSGGEQQRVALARALAPQPRLVLLDEPFANLDAALRQQLRGEVRAILRDAGATALLVTHDQEEALSMADTVAVMMNGRLLQVDSPETLYHRPASVEVARFIGDGQLLECRVEGGRAWSALGELTCRGDDGPAHLLVRPEDLFLEPLGEDPEALSGRIRHRSFFGHDRLDEVEFGDGTRVKIRVFSNHGLEVGQDVAVRPREKTFCTFPRVLNS